MLLITRPFSPKANVAKAINSNNNITINLNDIFLEKKNLKILNDLNDFI